MVILELLLEVDISGKNDGSNGRAVLIDIWFIKEAMLRIHKTNRWLSNLFLCVFDGEWNIDIIMKNC